MKYRTAEAILRTTPETAEATQQSPGGFPLIPATSRMVELMEIAAARLMKPRLQEGEASVAVAMNVTYAAHSLRHPGNGSMRAVASYNGISGRLHRFTINAFDESGLIGTAEHTRAVVIERRVMGIAHQRAGKLDMPLMA